MTQQNDLGAIQVSGQTEMALADRLENASSGIWSMPLSKEDSALIVAALRRPAPTEPVRAALEKINEFCSGDHSTLGAIERLAQVRKIALAAISTAGDTGREAVPVAWRAFCQKTGGQMVQTYGLKDMLIEQANSLYAEHGYELQPLYASPLPAARIGREDDLYRIRDIIASHIACEKDCQSMPNGCGCALTAARALTASAPAGGWQDIATAPKDGTNVSLWHATWKCPVSARYIVTRESQCKWVESTLTTIWPDEAFTHWKPIQGPADTARDAGSDAVTRAERVSPTASSPAGSALSQRLPE